MNELENKMELIKADVSGIAQKVALIKVVDDASQAAAISFLSEIKARQKRIEELRKFFTGDLNAQIKKINTMFKAQSEPLEEFEVTLKKEVQKYMDEQDKLAREKAEALRKEQEAAEKAKQEAMKTMTIEEAQKVFETALVVAEPEVVAPPKSVRTEAGMATRKMVWKWVIEDEVILRKTHPELFMLNEKAVNELVSNGTRTVAGIKIFQESQISIR